jgi:hypothetical protein
MYIAQGCLSNTKPGFSKKKKTLILTTISLFQNNGFNKPKLNISDFQQSSHLVDLTLVGFTVIHKM